MADFQRRFNLPVWWHSACHPEAFCISEMPSENEQPRKVILINRDFEIFFFPRLFCVSLSSIVVGKFFFVAVACGSFFPLSFAIEKMFDIFGN